MSLASESKRVIPDYENFDYTTVWNKRTIEDRAERELVSRWATGETGIELGGGFGRITQVIEKRVGRTFMLDYSLNNLRRAATRLRRTTLVRASIGRLPFDDSVFDFVALIRVMQHIPDPDALLGEVVRVARDGATFVLGIANEGNRRGGSREVRITRTRTGHEIYLTPLARFGHPGLRRAEILGVGAFDNVVGRSAWRLWPLISIDVKTSRLWPIKSMLFVRYTVSKAGAKNEPTVRCTCGGTISGRRCDRCGRAYGEIIDLVES